MATPPPTPELTLDAAITLLSGGRLGAVLDAAREGVARLSDAQLGELTSAALGVRALAEGLAFALTAEADARGVIAASTAAGTSQWVRERAEDAELSLTPGVGQAFAEVTTATRSPGMAVLKTATTLGRIPVAGAKVVAREFRKIRSQIDPLCHEAALQGLINYCAGGATGRALGEARDVIVSQYGLAEEFRDDDARRHACRHMSGFTRTKDGMYTARLEADPASHAIIEAALNALSAPTPSADGFSDTRTPGQRRVDAVVELASVVATNPDLLALSRHTPPHAPGGRAARARLTLTMPYTWLADRVGHARTGFNQPLTPADARRIACDADIIPAVLGSPSQPLDLGRAARLATPTQRAALTLRDGGCTFPGCDRPPSWCQTHHIDEWATGGPTDLTNLTLLCTRHHTIVHRDNLTATITTPTSTTPTDTAITNTTDPAERARLTQPPDTHQTPKTPRPPEASPPPDPHADERRHPHVHWHPRDPGIRHVFHARAA